METEFVDKALEDRKAIRKQIKALQESYLKLLPEFPENAICPSCGCNDWLDAEEGYFRWSRMEFEMESILDEDGEELDAKPKVVKDRNGNEMFVATAFMDGWDDMSEDGDLRYLVCRGCWNSFGMPAVEIEYS